VEIDLVTMYCPQCKMNVLTAREDLDICLAIILLIFTGGIGLIIYLAIYYGRDPNRCVHCNSICTPKLAEQERILNTQNKTQNYKPIQLVPIENEQISNESHSKYCFNCGVQLDERDGLKFCPFCGTNIIN